jgi:hypothetical protein
VHRSQKSFTLAASQMAFSPILVSNLIIYWATNLSIVPF